MVMFGMTEASLQLLGQATLVDCHTGLTFRVRFNVMDRGHNQGKIDVTPNEEGGITSLNHHTSPSLETH